VTRSIDQSVGVVIWMPRVPPCMRSVVSGSANLVVGGTTKAAGPDKFGGQLVQGGETRRISQGDMFIMPPDTLHWYRDVTAPFRYIEVPVP